MTGQDKEANDRLVARIMSPEGKKAINDWFQQCCEGDGVSNPIDMDAEEARNNQENWWENRHD